MKKNVWLPLAAAVGWAALLLPAALYIPIENPQRFSYQVDGHTVNRWVSLVRGNGDRILLVVAIPLIISLIATCFLTLQSHSKGRVFGWIARCAGVLLLTGAFVGTVTFLVGIFVVPGGVFLLVSCTNLHRNQALTSSSLNTLSESRWPARRARLQFRRKRRSRDPNLSSRMCPSLILYGDVSATTN